MKFSVNRLFAAPLFFLAFSVQILQAQCLVHTTSDTLCKNIASLLPVQLLGPTFATADSFLYELNGQRIDGSKSRIWYDTGNYQLIVTSLNTAGQTTCVDTAAFFVAPRPLVDYVITTGDTQCFEGNNICIKNQSTIWNEDSGSSIHYILFGDGSPEVSGKFNTGDSVCHTYVSLNSRQYYLNAKIIDQRGCESGHLYPANYLKGIGVNLYTFKGNWCGPITYGGTDLSITFDSTKIDSFVWMLDGVPFESTHLAFAYPLNVSGLPTLALKVWDKDGCERTDALRRSVFNPIITTDKADTLFIKDATISFSTPPHPEAQFYWNFGDPSSGPMNAAFKDTAKHTFSGPGKYTVILQEIAPACSTLADSLDVFISGPLAHINPPGYTVLASCSTADTVFLSQSSLYYFNDANPSDDHLAGGNRHDRVKGVWDFGDLAAPACTTDTKNGINVNSNCRYSLDSAAKHLFGGQEIYTVHYTCVDTVSMQGTVDSLTLQFGTPKLDDFEIESNCIFTNDFYLRWNTKSGRPQTTFRILTDSLADRNDNTPNVLDSWVNEGQTRYNYNTPNPFVKISGAAIHQAYFTAGYRQSFHTDGYTTVGLHLMNGDSNSGQGYCDTIIWFHKAILLPRQSLGFTSTLAQYTNSDSLTINLTDRRLQDISELYFGIQPDFVLDGNISGWGRHDEIIRNHQVGANSYDYILRSEGTTFGPEIKDSILIRHSNGGQLIFQDWRDTLIELPPTQFLRNGRFSNTFMHIEGCDAYQINYTVNGHVNALILSYPTADTFLFIGDTLQMMDTLLYLLEEPDPFTGAPFDAYSYWRDPLHYPDGRNRPTPSGGYETVEWKANGSTFATGINAQFIPTDTGWYTIEAISKDSTGRKQTLRKEIPVFGISPNLGILPDTSSLGPKLEQGDPQTQFNPDLNGLLINRDCDYYIQFEQQSVVLDPCLSRYGTPCLPEIKSGVRPGSNGPISMFTNSEPVILSFDVLNENQYGLVYQIASRTIQFDTLIDLEISLDYLVTDTVLCNDEALFINNLSTGLGQDVQYLVQTGDKQEIFGDTSLFTLNSLQRGIFPASVDAYPGEFLPGGIYCPISIPLGNIRVNGADQIEITGNVSGSAGQINLFTAEIGHTGSGTYLWTIDNGTLLSASNKDTISAIFAQGNGKLMVFYSESLCPAASDTLYFITTGFSQIPSGSVSLYPNPTKGTLHLHGLEGRAVVRIYSSQGVEVFNEEVNVGEFEIDGLKPGFYYLKIEGMDGWYFRFVLEE
ncbi:MAG TPA: hypothetical protein DIW47_15710 [Bacteroidetes bacterium]|nr:hypothetical protein [Bacteroidota bacterium]